MILTKYVTVKNTNYSYKRYTELGYTIDKAVEEFNVHVTDLPRYSKHLVIVQCTWCRAHVEKGYGNYLTELERAGESPTSSCSSQTCVNQQRKTNNLKKYGVTSPMKLTEVQNKVKRTTFERYGVENVFLSDEFQEKARQVVKEKYGNENIFATEYGKQKIVETNLKKYGVPYAIMLEETREKANQTRIKRGSYYFANMFYMINGKACSRQQKELGEYLGGKINAYVSGKFIDIQLKEKVLIEYDGGGHWISVKTNQITMEEFSQKEYETDKNLLEQGYTIIRIRNREDIEFDYETIQNYIQKLNDTSYVNIIVS